MAKGKVAFLFGWAKRNNINIPKLHNGEVDIEKLFEMYNQSRGNGIKKSRKEELLSVLKSKHVYTEEEYNNFGWARANSIINAGQNKDFTKKFAEILEGKSKAFKVLPNGEYFIPVSDLYDKDFEGVNNTIIFAKGTIENPIIAKVVQILEFDETTLDEKRRELYALERRGIQQKTGGVFNSYTRADVGDYARYKRKSDKDE